MLLDLSMQWLGTPSGKRGRSPTFSDTAKVSFWPALAAGVGGGPQPAALCQAGLAGSGLQHGLPTPEDLAGRADLPAEQIAVAIAGGLQGHQVPGRRRVETLKTWCRVSA